MKYANALMEPRIEKVVVNIGAGESGEKLVNAITLLERLTGCKPIRTISKSRVPAWGVKKGDPLGCKVTLRGKKAGVFLKDCFKAVDNEVKTRNFDMEGNLSFGIREYIDFPNAKYDPDIGIFGMDVTVTMERAGYRVKRRRLRPKKIPQKKRITRDESIDYFKKKFKINVVDE
ncbi:MAG: 50S ribosomal protein L5 [Candidatus Altiarchaeales archaeon ex4484_96]|nr:MAG: 50S ribosomal protein L5 [Candidatus Altiarchaeales archaeon ex4484_96]